MVSFARQSLTRQRPQLITDHGNTVPDWSLPTSDQVIARWSVQPGATDEDRANREGVLIQWTALGPADVDVQAGDRILFNGTQYAIDGEPARWPSATGALDHTVLFLKRWEG